MFGSVGAAGAQRVRIGLNLARAIQKKPEVGTETETATVPETATATATVPETAMATATTTEANAGRCASDDLHRVCQHVDDKDP